MNSISHKWISCSFYYPRTYELCPALKQQFQGAKLLVLRFETLVSYA